MVGGVLYDVGVYELVVEQEYVDQYDCEVCICGCFFGEMVGVQVDGVGIVVGCVDVDFFGLVVGLFLLVFFVFGVQFIDVLLWCFFGGVGG